MRLTALVLTAALVATSCGDRGAVLVVEDGGPGGGVDPALCEMIGAEAAAQDVAQAFVEAVPAEFRAAAQVMVYLGDALDEAFGDVTIIDSDDESASTADAALPPELVASLTEPTIPAELADLADALEGECGPGPGVDAFRSFAAMSEMAQPAADDDYCRQLSSVVTAEVGGSEGFEDVDTIESIAPPEHSAALESLSAMLGDEAPVDDASVDAVVETLGGLGLYAESRCGAEGAFAAMLFFGALAGLSLDGPDGSGGADPSGDALAEAPPADASRANSLVPADSGVIFETTSVNLEEEDGYNASMVVPGGWELSDFGFGASYEAPSDRYGFFTEIGYDTGCDGVCQRTDWDSRLNGEDGYLTNYRDGRDITSEVPVEGSEGVVVISDSFSDGVEGLVVRWDDGADRYFSCQFTLDVDDVALADAFVAACEDTRPGWFPVG